MKIATISTTKSTIPVFLVNSFRFGHATLRNSDLTSRKYLPIRSQILGLDFLATADKSVHILLPLTGFSVNRMSFTGLAIFAQLNAIRIIAPVLITAIVPVLALSTF